MLKKHEDDENDGEREKVMMMMWNIPLFFSVGWVSASGGIYQLGPRDPISLLWGRMWSYEPLGCAVKSKDQVDEYNHETVHQICRNWSWNHKSNLSRLKFISFLAIQQTKKNRSSSSCRWSAQRPVDLPCWIPDSWNFAACQSCPPLRTMAPTGIDVRCWYFLRITVMNSSYARGGARDLVLEWVSWSMNCLSFLTPIVLHHYFFFIMSPIGKHIE